MGSDSIDLWLGVIPLSKAVKPMTAFGTERTVRLYRNLALIRVRLRQN
jgi:hypothetical protein